jgi:hypothetical protein
MASKDSAKRAQFFKARALCMDSNVLQSQPRKPNRGTYTKMQISGQLVSAKVRSFVLAALGGAFFLASGASALAHTSNPAQTGGPGQKPSPSHRLTTATPLSPAVPVDASSSDAAAKPATVSLREGKLTIETDNSDLNQILRDVSKASGMTVDGSVKNIRIFGVYGPGNPGDVLTDLLAGAGYNFMMVGKLQDGAPRELVLSAKSGGAPSPASPKSASAEDDDAAPDDDQPGPGAVTNVPPPPSEDPQVRAQQNLQRLQQQREQMQRQQQQNPPQ